MALAVQKAIHLDQIDICTAFLNGDIEEEIYMKKQKNIEEYLEKIIKYKKDAEIKQSYYIKLKVKNATRFKPI